MERTVDDLSRMAQDEADFLEIDIDGVKPAQTGGAGTGVKILGQDGETEADEVGFVAVHPGTADGDKMFKNHVKTGLRKLRRHMDGTGTTDEDTGSMSEEEAEAKDELERLAEEEDKIRANQAETPRTDPRQNQQNTSRAPAPDPVEPDLSVKLVVDDESIDDLEEQLDDILDDDLTERMDALEERLEKIESTFGQLGQ